jgi:release factor glutamine methyltransferase
MELSIAEALFEATQILRTAGVPESRREAGSLLAHVIQKDRTFLISHAEKKLEPHTVHEFRDVVERRAAGEPLQYITGYQDFYGRSFRVTPDVLIPRPETELLVEAALGLMHGSRFCDVGTGSACIAVTLLCERPDSRAVGLDVSPAALAVARENAGAQRVDQRIEFHVSDCFDALPENTRPFDLIVSNPPYVAADVVAGLQREVKDHEPMVALTPGPDGLSIIRRLITEAPQFLQKDGHLLLEIGFDQGEAVRELVEGSKFKLLETRPDLQGIPRIVILRRL